MAAMTAGRIMTSDVVTVPPDMPTREVAKLLLTHGISAAPVVDATGAPLGMVSEGDLIGRDETDREARRDWWLALLAEGEALNTDFLASVAAGRTRARDVMAAPVVSVTEATGVREVAKLLAEYRIKRVPVLREGRVVGIVSRADLLRAITEGGLTGDGAEAGPAQAHHGGLLAVLGERIIHRRHAAPAGGGQAPRQAGEAQPERLDADHFRELVTDHEHDVVRERAEARREVAEKRRVLVKALIDHHVGDDAWQHMLHVAREAAERGETEHMLLRFPAALCSDGGRAINAPEADWPSTLRGEAAEVYLRWERDLRPQGFHLGARVLDFPDGFPGDIGLFLVWGK